ncbi:hypothetical protein BSKO_11342 [Bryopsis sp. KO-2023]|nr:hypothetical protein BSKO_11342 [Bryopsis sp. KO-2023]
MEAPDVYHRGLDTLRVSRKKLHSKTRGKLVDGMQKKVPAAEQGVAIFKGGAASNHYDTDNEPVFRQESYFHYLFGVTEPNWYGAIDIKTGKSVLFMPRLPPSYAVWMGALKTTDDCKSIYAVDEVRYTDEIEAVLKSMNPACLHLMSGTNSDSGNACLPAEFDGIKNFKKETEHLYPVLRECRVFKTPEEIEILQYSSKIASESHCKMIQSCKPGMMEYQLESNFLHHCYFAGGSRKAAYTPISASGPNPAVLHYGHEGAPNDRQILDGDLVLCDMGCKYYGYDSDITTTFPASGKFTPNQKMVYEAVLNAHQSVIKEMKPGVNMLDMHKLAERCILQGLIDGGVLRGDVNDMLSKFLGGVFMPHGLGHMLGLDTHDVGGYPEDGPPRSTDPGRKNLRTARTLQENMVLTVEPGCYFIPTLLDEATQEASTKDFFVSEKLKEFEGFGGVRLEDNVVITPNGCMSMTRVPRTVTEIENTMASVT